MRVLFAPFVLALMLALGVSAAAGGWAVSTLDQLPEGFTSGQTYELGWTVRQHGVTPINVDSFAPGATSAIRATPVLGLSQTVTFTGTQSGPTGHYVAKVTFPSAGDWMWDITQGPFQPQALGTITVAPAAAAVTSAVPAVTAASPRTDPFRLALPFAAGVAGALFVATLALYLRGTRRTGAVA